MQFLNLNADERRVLLESLESVLGRNARVLEKDVMVCQILAWLFELPEPPAMAFKGGTSLSKVYQAINRFSEDIDVTLEYRDLSDEAIDLDRVSKSQVKKIGEQLKQSVATQIKTRILPHLEKCWFGLFGSDAQLEFDGEEKILVRYDSAILGAAGYLRDAVVLEFGGRNVTEPNEQVTIVPDIATHLKTLGFPLAKVRVLSPERTFWEKATLIHVENHRPNPRLDAERLSRHWYDLARLVNLEIGERAIANRELLKAVVHHKTVFFNYGYAHYDQCLTGGLRLIPTGTLLTALERDYKVMEAAGFFYGERLSFVAVLETIATLEQRINQESSL